MSKNINPDTAYPDSEFSEHSVSLLIDRLCDEFENSWKANRPISMERQLARVAARNRPALFRELLEIELDIRTAANDVFSVQDYLDRFPGEAELVDLAFRGIVRRKTLGDYELLEEIGHGGMGVVYRARQVFLNQIVAIKVLSQTYHSDANVVSRFRREMRMIGSLNHRNIVRAFNAGDSHGTLYLVMEFVDGLNLHQLVKRYAEFSQPIGEHRDAMEEPAPLASVQGLPTQVFPMRDVPRQGLPCGAAAEIIRQAAHGLDHAWSQGMVHRDLKPANLMTTREGTVKILDLGLGKFCAESRENDPHEAALTQIGATMGTVDYMSPEQCENATDADIRSDIYSLGCTLFFALTGNAPFDGTMYSSQRRKFLAHLAGDLPRIENFRSDCSPEFLDVFRKMIAREPGERFQSPEELLRAIAPFADEEEFRRVIARTPFPEEPGESPTPATSGGEDTLVGRGTSNDSFQRREEENRFRQKSVSPVSVFLRSAVEYGPTIGKTFGKKHRFAFFVALAVVLAAGVYGFFQVFRTAGPDDAASAQTPRSPVAAPPENWLADARAETNYEHVVRDLVQLPGIEGQWWFVETPWYLPFVRENIPATLLPGKADVVGYCRERFQHDDTTDTGIAYRNANPLAVREFLWNITQTMMPDMPEHRAALIRDLAETLDSPEETATLVPVLEAHLLRYEKGVGNWSASDYHTVALLQQRLSRVRRDPALAERAAQSYQNALREYARGDRYAKQMQAVCLADFMRLTYWKDKDFSAFKKQADLLLEQDDLSNMFRAVFLADYGNICMFAGRNNDALFEVASRVLERSALGTNEHPIAAYILERHAWSLIDQCQFPQAREKFIEALRIRQNNRTQTGNPFAAISVYHNMHGLALIRRYTGDAEGARSLFDYLVGEIRKAMRENTGKQESARQRYHSSFQERLANTLERFGDCTLYGGGAAFGTPESRVAISDLKNASEYYDQARTTYEAYGARYFVSCKSAIVKALLGSLEDAKAVLAELDRSGKVSFGTHRDRAEWLRHVADALVLMKEGELRADAEKIRSARALLRSFLSRFDDDSLNAPRFRRETLEMQFLAAELLIRSKLATEGVYAARKESASFLDPLLLPTVKLENTRPFFYRFYDLAVQCCEPTPQDADQPDAMQNVILDQLRYIRQSRAGESKAAAASEGDPGRMRSVLYFYFMTQNGVAILLSEGTGRAVERFGIPIPRSELLEAAKSGKTLDLPEELRTRIAREKADGREIEMFFSDRICWHREQDALLDANWPFSTPLQTWRHVSPDTSPEVPPETSR